MGDSFLKFCDTEEDLDNGRNHMTTLQSNPVTSKVNAILWCLREYWIGIGK